MAHKASIKNLPMPSSEWSDFPCGVQCGIANQSWLPVPMKISQCRQFICKEDRFEYESSSNVSQLVSCKLGAAVRHASWAACKNTMFFFFGVLRRMKQGSSQNIAGWAGHWNKDVRCAHCRKKPSEMLSLKKGAGEGKERSASENTHASRSN